MSSPIGDDDDFRDINELLNISFDHSKNNRISERLIGRGVDLLTNTFKGQAAGRHLIIVAASSPHAASASEWQQLAARMQREKIFLHVVMNPMQEMETINALFYNSLGQQNHQELVPWFPADTTLYCIRLAGTVLISTPNEGAFKFTYAIPAYPPNTPVVEPPLFFRNYTFPMDTVNTLQVPRLEHSSPQPPVAAEFVQPRIVMRMQKIHGVTHKKKHGTQPPIVPFLRSARVLASAPPSISSLTTTPASLIAESCLPAKLKANRAERLSSKSPIATSPATSSKPERRSSPFRRKRNSTLAPDLASSPNAGSSHPPSSPDMSSPGEGSWQKEATHHTYTTFPMASHGPGPLSPLYSTSLSTTESYCSSAIPPMPSSSSTGSPVVNDLDKPFNISPEYEAAVTASFDVFNTSNPSGTAVPDFTSTSSSYLSDPRQAHYNMYRNVEQLPVIPLPPQSNNPYFGRAQYEYSIDTQSTFTIYPAYEHDAIGTATSSLEGWNGQFPT